MCAPAPLSHCRVVLCQGHLRSLSWISKTHSLLQKHPFLPSQPLAQVRLLTATLGMLQELIPNEVFAVFGPHYCLSTGQPLVQAWQEAPSPPLGSRNWLTTLECCHRRDKDLSECFSRDTWPPSPSQAMPMSAESLLLLISQAPPPEMLPCS